MRRTSTALLRRRCCRHLSTAAARHTVVDIAASSDGKGVSEAGNVLLVEKQLQFKALQTDPGVRVDTSELFAASDDPLAHTAADVGKFFQFDPSTVTDLFFHTGFCGPDKPRKQLKIEVSGEHRAAIEALEQATVAAGVANSQSWFKEKKPLPESAVLDRFQSKLKAPSTPSAHIWTAVNVRRCSAVTHTSGCWGLQQW